MYVLYHFPYSQHARRVVSLLEEARLPYELRHVAMDQGEHLSAAYLAINPNHQVPTLIDGPVTLHESNAILRYLCLKHGLETWYPAEPALRAAVEQWLDWAQCRLSPSVVDIVRNRLFMGEAADKAAIERGLAQLPELAAILEAGLGGSGYLAGTMPTIADLALASSLFQLGLAGETLAGARIADWYERVGALDGFRRSLPAKQAA